MGKFFFSTNGSRRMAIAAGGNIGVGILDPIRNFHVKGISRFESLNNASGSSMEFYSGLNQSTSLRFWHNLTLPQSLGSISFNANGNAQWESGSTATLNTNGLGIDNAAPLTKLHILGGQDASLTASGNGYLMMGVASGNNLVIDNNEIISRNNGAVSRLYLQADGGETEIGNAEGSYRFTNEGELNRPAVTGNSHLLPVAYGKIRQDGVRLSGTFFTSIREADGRYRVTLLNENNMLNEEDQFTIMVTPYGSDRGIFVTAQINNATSFLVNTSEFHVAYINKSTPDGCGIPCDNTLVSFINPLPGERSKNASFSFLVFKN